MRRQPRAGLSSRNSWACDGPDARNLVGLGRQFHRERALFPTPREAQLVAGFQAGDESLPPACHVELLAVALDPDGRPGRRVLAIVEADVQEGTATAAHRVLDQHGAAP